jgi:crotonobetainyl-CoA:carnitine CoA-transferase CaiB-like acyl-CoA transferase
VLDFREAFDQPHLSERRLLVEADGRHHIAPPIRFASEPEWQPGEVPGLGTD